jgi:hypothetical protein
LLSVVIGKMVDRCEESLPRQPRHNTIIVESVVDGGRFGGDYEDPRCRPTPTNESSSGCELLRRESVAQYGNPNAFISGNCKDLPICCRCDRFIFALSKQGAVWRANEIF